MTKTLYTTMKRNAATMIRSAERLGYFVVPSIAQRGDDTRLLAAGFIVHERGEYRVTDAGMTAARKMV